jgi:hypothetical protein
VDTGSNPHLQQAGNRPESDSFVSENNPPVGRLRTLGFMIGVAVALVLAVETGSAQSVWQRIAQFIGLQGKPEPASANVLSEHETAELDKMTPQAQAQLLLERSINHYRGANGEIAERVHRCQGKIELDQQLNSLFMTALNPDDSPGSGLRPLK